MIHNLLSNTSNFKFKPFLVELQGTKVINAKDVELYIPFIADCNNMKNVEYIVSNITQNLMLNETKFYIKDKRDPTFTKTILEANQNIQNASYELEVDLLQNIYNIKQVKQAVINDDEIKKISIVFKEI